MSMVVNGLDLNYLGVSNVWNNDLGLFVHLVLKYLSKLTKNRERFRTTLYQR